MDTTRHAPHFDDETQARPIDAALIAITRQTPRRDVDVPSESLPSLEVAAPFDAYETRFGDRATSRRNVHHENIRNEGIRNETAPARYVARESGEQLRDDVYEEPVTQAYPPNTEGSGPRPRKATEAYESNRAEARREERREEKVARREPAPARRDGSVASAPPSPLAPTANPQEANVNVPAGFVVGVQPIRTGVVQPMFHQPQVPATALVGRQHAAPVYAPLPSFPTPPARHPVASSGRVAAPTPMHVRPANAPTTGHHVAMSDEAERQRSKLGRFAFFVFGAAFGIFFAFFATGFAPQFGKTDDASAEKPAPETKARPVVTAVSAPVAQPPAPQPVAQQPVPPPVAQQPALPPGGELAPPAVAQPVAPAPAPSQAPTAMASTPRAPRTSGAVRRSSSPAPRTNADSDETPSTPARNAPAESDNAGDLLSAGLGP